MCIFGSHTFAPRSWMCKKQTSGSHSSTEAEIISPVAGLRMDGIPALDLKDLVTEVFHSSPNMSAGHSTNHRPLAQISTWVIVFSCVRLTSTLMKSHWLKILQRHQKDTYTRKQHAYLTQANNRIPKEEHRETCRVTLLQTSTPITKPRRQPNTTSWNFVTVNVSLNAKSSQLGAILYI